jgi:hypothetical protein
MLSMGPLKGERFRFAKIRPGEDGGCVPNAAPPSLRGARTTRMFVGKEEDVGVAGRTFTEACGDFVLLWPETETAGEAIEAEDVEDALECE